MRIVQTVFGVFHHFELARELERRGHLERIYSTWPWQRLRREGLPRERVESFPWVHTPEMLLRRTSIQNQRFFDHLGYLNALSFDRFTSSQLRNQPAPEALIAISGSSLRTGREVQARGSRFICDRGSSHQRFQETLVLDEFRRWGVTRAAADERDTAREELIYSAADAITVPSTFAARSFIEMGVDPAKLHVIPYGVRLESFKKTADAAADRFDVLFAGSVSLRKGVPYLLEAFSRLRHPHKRLRIAGAMQEDLRLVLARLPQQQVEFLGSVDQSQLARLMSESHVLVLPSIEEGLALVQGQALACGCPVIASTNTGSEDLFHDAVEGFIVAIRDPDAILERMQRLADDPKLQQKMSAAALARVRFIGGWQQYGDRWEMLLQQLLAARS